MKNTAFLTFTVFLLVACTKQETNGPASHVNHNQHQDLSHPPSEKLMGMVSKELLFNKHPDFKEKFLKSAVNSKQLYQIKTIQEPAHLVIIFGTWCHDSQREVPRLLRLLDMANNPQLTYQLIAVDTDKQIPSEANLSYTIERTPTVIAERDGKEIGRIVETPDANWPVDLAAILATNN